jgi:Domain of unknown function (DUF6895)
VNRRSTLPLAARRSLKWLLAWADWFDPLSSAAEPSESLLTALAELSLLVIQAARCPGLSPLERNAFASLRRTIREAYQKPRMHQFVEHGPPDAAVGNVLIWLAAADHGAEDILTRQDLIEIIRRRNVTALERTPMRMLELRYFLDLAQIPHSLPSAVLLLRMSILGNDVNISELTESSVYAITHLIFYAADFGFAQSKVLARKRLIHMAAKLLGDMLDKGNWDLAAELILAYKCVGGSDNTLIAKSWRRLSRAQDANGAFGSQILKQQIAHVHCTEDVRKEVIFLKSYHKPLVTVLAGMLSRHVSKLRKPSNAAAFSRAGIPERQKATTT